MVGSGMIIGIHGSGLARFQGEALAEAVSATRGGFEVRLEVFEELGGSRTTLHDDHVAENRGEIGQLHSRLRSGEIDVVVHRGFDLRGDVPEDLRIAAVLPRQNPYDVLLSHDDLWLDELDETHRVGVVHLRARAQLLDYRSDLEWGLVSGDATDWLASMVAGELDALIAPGAAIEQLGLQDRVCEIFPPELIVPAPGSGVLVCLVRADDEENRERLKVLHDPDTLVEYVAEVALVESLGGAWEQPIGALARLEGGMLQMAAMVASPDGKQILRDQFVAARDDPALAGEEFAALLLHAGAAEVLEGEDLAGDAPPDVPTQLPARTQDDFEDDFDFEEFAEFGETNDDDDPEEL
jgi:hydroxymethylbilane synthase